MDQASDETLRLVIEAIEAMPARPLLKGFTVEKILKDGKFEEAGTKYVFQDVGLAYLYSGLAVLARDTYFYLKKKPRKDGQEFARMVEEVNAEEALIHGDDAFPYYSNISEAKELPNTFAEIEKRGYADISKLSGPDFDEPNIIHEWTFKPGKRFFLKLGGKARETICGAGGPYRLFNKGDKLLGQSQLPMSIAVAAATAAFAPAVFWYPLAAYGGLLILKTGLKTYCEA